MRRVQVNESDFAPLDRPVRGEGGFQNLLRRSGRGTILLRARLRFPRPTRNA